jgi:hypothetical protein
MSEDGGSMFLRNVGIYLQVHTTLQPCRSTSTSSPQWYPQVSYGISVALCTVLARWQRFQPHLPLLRSIGQIVPCYRDKAIHAAHHLLFMRRRDTGNTESGAMFWQLLWRHKTYVTQTDPVFRYRFRGYATMMQSLYILSSGTIAGSHTSPWDKQHVCGFDGIAVLVGKLCSKAAKWQAFHCEDGRLLARSSVQTGISLPRFRRSVLPPSSGR